MLRCLLITEIDAHGPWEAIRARKQTNGHPLEQDALSWVKFNLDICEHSHESCSANINRTLPIRTLHLKGLGKDMVEVKLVENKLRIVTGRYATLSHRWGNHQTCITTKSNISDHRCGIPWPTIPKTFRDAMIYCLKLGIEYIWIDALCIIQDSPRDWQQQSAEMAGIYKNSYLTLSATTATNDSAGCFSMDRSAPAQSNKSLSGKDSPIYIREKLRHWTDPGGGILKERFPLFTRAWVFQERILSTRTLHFCDRELVWECAETTICECDSVSVDTGMKQQFAKSPRYAKDKTYIEQARAMDNEETANDLECGGKDTRCMSVTDRMRKDLWKLKKWRTRIFINEEIAKAKLKKSLSLRVQRNVRPAKLPRDYDELEMKPQEPPVRSSSWDRAEPAIPSRQVLRRQRRTGLKAVPTDRISGRTDKILIKGQALQQTNGRDLEIWHRMVEQYSNLKLTRISDRLPALSGLAERIAPESRFYLAGLWKDTLRLDLLWRVDQISEAHQRVPDNLSPTWSWSSVSSGVKYWTREDLKENIFYTQRDLRPELPYGPDYFNSDALIRRWQANRAKLDQLSPELLDWCLSERSCTSITSITYEMVQIGANPFGEVGRAVLQIRGYVRQASLKYVKVRSGEGHHDWEVDPLQYQLDFTAKSGIMAQDRVLRDVHLHFYADYNLSELHNKHQVLDNEVVHLLEVLVNLFLVLRRTELGDYQRIGIFRARPTFDQSYGIDLMLPGEMQDLRLV